MTDEDQRCPSCERDTGSVTLEEETLHHAMLGEVKIQALPVWSCSSCGESWVALEGEYVRTDALLKEALKQLRECQTKLTIANHD